MVQPGEKCKTLAENDPPLSLPPSLSLSLNTCAALGQVQTAAACSFSRCRYAHHLLLCIGYHVFVSAFILTVPRGKELPTDLAAAKCMSVCCWGRLAKLGYLSQICAVSCFIDHSLTVPANSGSVYKSCV